MRRYFLFILIISAVSLRPASAGQMGAQGAGGKYCQASGGRMDCESGSSWCKKQGGSSCSPEMRGRCGKRRGDWYGASRPVATDTEARTLLRNYFAGQEYTVSDVMENKWGFEAVVFDKNGTVIDRVMIDKRSGRIRSMD
ncbi:MAG: hypothetical protein PHI31_08340 [Desulfuromonadaceae bacterium]|nr:hypothetical protein [Desulfuromonadaceae bacterium]